MNSNHAHYLQTSIPKSNQTIIPTPSNNQSCANFSRTAIRRHFHSNCVSSKLNDIATSTRPNSKYEQHANSCNSGPRNVFFGSKSPKPIVDNVTKQKYAPSTILQFSHNENMTVPMQMYVVKIKRIIVIGTCGLWV